MIRSGLIARTGAAVAAGGLVLGLSAIPAGSQVAPASPLQVSGTVECQVIEGDYLWVIDYTAENLVEPQVVPASASVPAAYGDIDITSAPITLDGAPVGSASFSPNPVPALGTATDGGSLPGSFTGTLGLTVNWTSSSIEDSGSEVVDLALDTTCAAPVTTTTSRAPAVEAEAVAVSPAFTG
jgi:hypothetical protein